MPYRHELRVRYAEVDMQGHAFNAHYLTYADEALDAWWRSILGDDYTDTFDFDLVLKRANITWHGPARFGQILGIEVSVGRWGNTSFDVVYQGAVGEQPVFEAVVTYVCVSPGVAETGPRPMAIPADLRAALG
jgi:acyl-CoA thioester hydrolase